LHFDSLWIISEIDKQNIIKQTYFKIFKEPQLRDEYYRRKWLLKIQKQMNWLLLESKFFDLVGFTLLIFSFYY
jgi:hypothetical protein